VRPLRGDRSAFVPVARPISRRKKKNLGRNPGRSIPRDRRPHPESDEAEPVWQLTATPEAVEPDKPPSDNPGQHIPSVNRPAPIELASAFAELSCGAGFSI